MKYRGLIILGVVFFLIVQTAYFWEPQLAYWGMFAFLLLVIVFMALAGLLLSHGVKLIQERFRNRQRILVVAVLFVAVSTSFFKPAGLIDYDPLSGRNLLIASREGAANCLTVLKLKKNNTFVERRMCFGATEVKGSYSIKGDTILFTNVKPGRFIKEYYQYAVINKNKADNYSSKIIGDLVLYKDKKDTTGYSLWITKNDFPL